MESAELKSNRRVRHCYPRSEVYHRWVHDETLVYHSQSLPVWGKYNWLDDVDNFIRYYHLEKEFGIMTEEEVDALYKQKKTNSVKFKLKIKK